MKTKELKERLNNGYGICHKCAKENGAKSDGWCHTNFISKCTVCEKEVGCMAVTDYIWPKKLGVGYIWD